MNVLSKLFQLFGGQVVITEIMNDDDFFIFEVSHKSLMIDMQAFKTIDNECLYLKKIDVFVRDGATGLNKAMIIELGEEFCRKYGTTSVIFEGGKRTTGRGKGKYPTPIRVDLKIE